MLAVTEILCLFLHNQDMLRILWANAKRFGIKCCQYLLDHVHVFNEYGEFPILHLGGVYIRHTFGIAYIFVWNLRSQAQES